MINSLPPRVGETLKSALQFVSHPLFVTGLLAAASAITFAFYPGLVSATVVESPKTVGAVAVVALCMTVYLTLTNIGMSSRFQQQQVDNSLSIQRAAKELAYVNQMVDTSQHAMAALAGMPAQLLVVMKAIGDARSAPAGTSKWVGVLESIVPALLDPQGFRPEWISVNGVRTKVIAFGTGHPAPRLIADLRDCGVTGMHEDVEAHVDAILSPVPVEEHAVALSTSISATQN